MQEYKQIRVRKETYEALVEITSKLQVMMGKKVSFSDAIDYLIKNRRDKKIEVKL